MRVLICDDHTLIRAGLRRLVESFDDVQVVAEAASADEVVIRAREHQPEAILLDLSMPGRSGFEALARGASGFVVKEAAPAELEIALRAAAAGRTYLSPQVSAPQLRGNRPDKPDTREAADALPPRQREILAMLGQGRTTKQIAGDLGISVKTVETHRARMMEALGCRNAMELLRTAMRLHGEL